MRGRRALRPCAGFTLAEVLVALFVVALGVAGAAAVQAVAVRAAGEAARLSDGTRLAASLAQRMRANPAAMALPDAANPYLQFDAEAGEAAATVSCYDADCSPAQMANADLADTAEALSVRFPGGRMRVCRDDQQPDPAGLLPWSCTDHPGAPVTIKLGWHARRGVQDVPVAKVPMVFLTLGAGTP
ncbi:type IV pilus modification protein PilV [Massilia sp. LXY-6]|uniref:type IV pilus modification protein PilV n=1 Tax=Massilia sp. LXY-6 TaxID=3379823 RepID=UPI003EE2EB29